MMLIRSFSTAIAGLLLAQTASSAVLRRKFQLSGDQVHIGDIWDDVGSKKSVILGPGPKPGDSIIVDKRQLAAIADEFGIDWQSTTAPDEIVISRPGSSVPTSAISDAVRRALLKASTGIPEDELGITLSTFQPPMIDNGDQPELDIDHLRLDPATRQFEAICELKSAAGQNQQFPISGRFFASQFAVIAAHSLQPGLPLQAQDIALGRVEADNSGNIITDQNAVIGQVLQFPLAAGQVVHPADLYAPILVHRHDAVIVSVQLPGLVATVIGESLDQAAKNQPIRIRNITSGAVITGRVIGADQATLSNTIQTQMEVTQ